MNLPETWRLVRLSAICEINPPLFRDEKPSLDTLVSFVPMAAVDEIEGKITRPETRALREVSRGFTPFREHDVLFAKITPSMENGKAAIATGLQNGVGFGSTEFHVLRPTEHLLPDYLFYFIRQSWFRERASAAFVGSAGQQRVPQDFLERVILPLPSVPEQQCVVAILRQADELRRLRREILEQVHKLPLALFIETFGDPIGNPKNYRKVALGRLGQLDRGVSKHRPRDAAFLYGGDYPFVQTGDVTSSGGWITNHSQTYSEAGLTQSRLWPKGTLCITIAANIARTGILTLDACFPDSVVGFLPGPEVTTEYVMYAIRLLQHQLEVQAPQAAQKNINLQVLRRLQIPLPDFNAQKDFSKQVDHIRQYLFNSQESEKSLGLFFDTLQTEGFSADLTAVWRASHRRELEVNARSRDAALARVACEATVLELPPIERTWRSQLERDWLLNQLSKEQGTVWEALQMWPGTLIPAEEIDEFRLQCFSNGSLDNTNAYILRALDQLAGLGLVVKLSMPNQQGEYVTGYRSLCEDELSHIADGQSLAES